MDLQHDQQKTEIAKAESVVWDILKKSLESRGKSEAVFYLQYLLSARAVRVTREGRHKRVFLKMYQRISDYESRYNSITGEQMSWFFSVLMEGSDSTIDEANCLRAAQEAARPSQDARLEVSHYEEQGGKQVYIARWGHQKDGIPVERDYLQVLVNGKTGRPFAFHRKWHQISEIPTER